jgi:large subunit ribosomal protein L9
MGIKIIITSNNIANLGDIGSVVSVSNGFARNYLIPKSLAVYATEENLLKNNSDREKNNLEKNNTIQLAKEICSQIDNSSIEIEMSSDGENLYGSVGNNKICTLINEKILDLDFMKNNKNSQFSVSHHQIKLSDSKTIKKIGSYKISISICNYNCCVNLLIKNKNNSI